jgi:hypothetical protein
MRWLICLVPCLLAADSIPVKPADRGAEEEISTDRPDFTEATDTVASGMIQLESGLRFGKQGTVRQVGGPFPLVRIGLNRIAELRWGTDGFAMESDGGRRHLGGSDAEAGIKVRLHDEGKYTPAFAVIGGVSFPSGARYFSSGGTDPFLNLCWSKSLPNEFDAAGNFNFRRETWADETERAASLTVGRRVAAGMRAFGEVYRISAGQGDDAEWVADTGLTRLLGKGAQADFAVGRTLRAPTPYWFVLVGFAVKFRL